MALARIISSALRFGHEHIEPCGAIEFDEVAPAIIFKHMRGIDAAAADRLLTACP